MANANPSTGTRFKLGQSGNPGGKTSAQRKLEVENAERATRLRHRILVALECSLDKAEDEGDEKAIALISSELLRLLKDSEDRGLGQPTSRTAITDEEGNDLPSSIMLEVLRRPTRISDGMVDCCAGAESEILDHHPLGLP